MSTVTYAYKNKYIHQEFIDDLYRTLEFCRLEHACRILNQLGVAGTQVLDDTGHYVTIAELICWYGESALCKTVFPIYFYGGPERESIFEALEDQYVLMKGSVLTFLLDSILLAVSIKGYDILEPMDLPL